MSIIDDELEKRGLKFEDLKPGQERDTYFEMEIALRQSVLTPETLKAHISTMKTIVSEELAKEPEFIRVFIFKFRNDNNILLKARLRNYMLLETFLDSPDKAKKAIADAISQGGIVKKLDKR